MNGGTTNIPHLEAGQLVRILDGESVEGAEHIAGCDICAAELRGIAAESKAVAGGLALLGGAPDDIVRARARAAVRAAARRKPASRWQRPAWRAAAAIVIVAGAGIVAVPVAARIVDWARAWTPVPGREAVVDVAPEALPPTGAPVRFRPTDLVFRVELQHRQVGGAVTVRPVDGDHAIARIMGGGDESLVVLPSGILVDNGHESNADYFVDVPIHAVRRIQVIVAGALLEDRMVTETTGPILLQLASDPVHP